nr:hypothetical protein [uncultured bacterium]
MKNKTMEYCTDCSAEIGIDEETCPECGMFVAQMTSHEYSGLKTNWLTNYKHKKIFSVLFWPSLIIFLLACFLFPDTANKNLQVSTVLFFASLTFFCPANTAEIKGVICNRYICTHRSDNPKLFNFSVNLVLVLSLFMLLMSFWGTFKDYS